MRMEIKDEYCALLLINIFWGGLYTVITIIISIINCIFLVWRPTAQMRAQIITIYSFFFFLLTYFFNLITFFLLFLQFIARSFSVKFLLHSILVCRSTACLCQNARHNQQSNCADNVFLEQMQFEYAQQIGWIRIC